MKYILVSFFFIVTLLIVPVIMGSAVDAAYLKFDKPTVSVSSGQTFQLEAIVDAGTEQIRSTAMYILYDSAVLEAQSVTDGTFFPDVVKTITPGKVYISGLPLPSDIGGYKTGSGTVATVTFKALKDGTATITYDCSTSASNTSKIIKNDYNSTNIINCSQNGTSVVTVGTGTSTSGTTGGSTSPTAAPIPSQLPQSGTFDNVVNYAFPGIILVMMGGLLKFLL